MAWESDSPTVWKTMSNRLVKRTLLATLVGSATIAFVTGCRTTQQSSIPNPFLSADKVPAPASRVPVQGSAQAYYPGDPLPPLPAAQPAMQPLGALPPSNDITPIPADSTFTNTPRSTSNSLANNEAGVRIPTDTSDMRFASLPQTTIPQHPPQQTVAAPNPNAHQVAITPVMAANQRPAPTETVFREPKPPVTAPVISNWPPVAAPAPQAAVPSVASNPTNRSEATSGLFRNPVVPLAPALLQQTPAASTTMPPNTIPSTAGPRIRLPGSADRIREDVVAPGTINTTSYQVGVAGGGRVQTMTIPPSGYNPASLADQDLSTPPNLGDGFRARGSSRRQFNTRSSDSTVPVLRVTPG